MGTEKVDFWEDVVASDSVKDCLVQLTNCRVLRDHSLNTCDMWMENGKILNPEKVFFEQRRCPSIQVDCHDSIISAGFIDVQLNGAFGCDFSTDKPDFNSGVQNSCQKLLQYGVTSFCPTLISLQSEAYQKILPKLHRRPGSKEGAGILGVHLEGPFINRDKRGAHPDRNIMTDGFPTGSEEDLIRMYGTEVFAQTALLTLAPELPNAMKIIPLLSQRGIQVSLGHSMASIIEGERAIQMGASSVTHLFNAMLPFHHRDPGLVGLLASKYIHPERLFYGVISDGIHTHDSALRIAHRTHPGGLVLITDAMAALGLGDGLHRLGDLSVLTQGLRATLDGKNTLAGSVSSLDYCVRHLVKAARCSKVEALECASLHPARLLNITSHKGTLDFGTDADFVLLDEDLNVKATFIAGQLVYSQLNLHS